MAFCPVSLYARILSDLNLCRPCACCQFLWGHVCVSPVVSRKWYFLGIIYYLWLLHSFFPLFYIDPWVLREECDKDFPFRSESPKLSFSLPIVQLWVFMFITIDARSIYDESSVYILNYGYSNMSSGIILLLCSIGRIIVISIPLGPMHYTASGSWCYQQY